jgi:hypothetical protein
VDCNKLAAEGQSTLRPDNEPEVEKENVGIVFGRACEAIKSPIKLY